MSEETNRQSTVEEEEFEQTETPNEGEDNNQEETATEELSEVEQLKEENAAVQDRLARLQADFDNFRRRSQKEREADLKYKAQDIVNDLIPVVDNFERALQVDVQDEATESYAEGMRMVYNQLKQALIDHGVEEIEAEGAEFDPQKHQAVMQVSEEGYESNQIIEVMQKGYLLKDRVIRPAMVKVNE
ncbi:nucleotide exchange factor GrpE [Alkalibacillus almallahensis]|uniref:nucleotide exchange factor GrpE n=1 Tax=Alkalibacillus almallahensis TaxID=1379154 RepID=UPI001420BACA|nr:nucleotide exchange factor GrpE [Alkalibacillus almallahensis]NIK11324.1 molecular chaperone GrpE [Alkalibacillus almallahensis]